MGVNSLWTIIGPSARPVRLEALSRKKLAVDASIWIYQFLKAVRDQDGNALPQSHIVGFFRRICKLLYHGILPIFVFDGGAPVLKRKTITQRKERRQQGNKETTEQTAKRILARQIQRYSDKDSLKNVSDVEDKKKSSEEVSRGKSSQSFRQKDEYHLPEIESFKVSVKDGRIMPKEEFDEMSAEFDYVDGIDINTVDPNSKEFSELPTSTQYMILSHLRIRSRLRLGYDKRQLETLFPDRMDFSRFQIEQVQKRNFYTQRLMDISGMGENGNTEKRIAGDKDKRYALVRNEDGWTLSLGGESASKETPILIDDELVDNPQISLRRTDDVPEALEKAADMEIKDEDDESEWDDVPLGTEENDEERQFHKAIIESIYEQYSDEKPASSLPEKGFQAETDKTGIFQKSKEDDIINDGMVQISEPHTINDEGNKGQQLLEESSFSLGKSFLFHSISDSNSSAKKLLESNDNEAAYKEGSSNASEELQTKNRNLNLQSTNPELEFEHKNDSNRDIADNSSSLQMRASNPDELKVDNEKSKSKEETTEETVSKSNDLPLWFNDNISIDDNPYKDTVFSNNDHVRHQDMYEADEKAGLIPWNEAKSMLIHNSDEESSRSNIEEREDGEEVEEIQEVFEVKMNHDKPAELGQDSKVVESTQRKPVLIDYDFEEEEENNLIEQLVNEEIEHESFKSEIKNVHNISNSSINTFVTDEQLAQEQLNKAKRDSDEVTENMIRDVQELLKRFGIPYITAPMEAEAQCAELLKLNLVDGIITDDSDCFLFGGDKVYKNMFNQKQYVECFLMKDIESKIGLDQDRLVELALLLGSDYTEGIKGIGPVLAMEILAEFGNLKNFKAWFDENTKPTKSKDQDISSLKKNLLGRIKGGKLFLQDSFPDRTISEAYKLPEVDHDKSEFKWGVPDLDQIRSFLMYNVNWNQGRVDEIMIPLIRDMNRKKAEGVQSKINEFFPQEYISAKKDLASGKRMKNASFKLSKKRRM